MSDVAAPPAFMEQSELLPPTTVRFVVPGTPRGKARPRASVIGGHAHIYTPKVTASEEGAVRLFAQQAMRGRPPLEGPLFLGISAYMPIPESWSRKKKAEAYCNCIRPTGRPDLDNITKLVADGLNSIVMRDDSQVVQLSVLKAYSAKPRVEIFVAPVRAL